MTGTPFIARLGVVGTGRVARALALGLAPACAAPPLVWGRSAERASEALAAIGQGASADSLAALVSRCDVIAIAVADDALASMVTALAAAGPFAGASLVFHVSGASGVGPLAPLAGRGARIAAIHPAMTFTGDPVAEVRRMAGAGFAVTGADPEGAALAGRIVAALGGVAIAIPDERRALYHAALSHAANHVVTLLSGAGEALAAAGVDDPAVLLAPLVRAAVENTLSRGFAALSGPVLRGDADTVSAHLAALADAAPAVLEPYRAMARATCDALGRREPGSRAALREVLRGQIP